jgi:putative ABC transport system ATP-binding protein
MDNKISAQMGNKLENEAIVENKERVGNEVRVENEASNASDNRVERHEELTGDLIIEGINIVRNFKMGEVEVRALRGVNVKIRRGAFIAIMGPSGSGKTTLLNQLGLLDTPNSGKVIIVGTDTSRMSDREKGEFRLHNLGYVFQDYALLPELNASENVYISLMMQGKSKSECESTA